MKFFQENGDLPSEIIGEATFYLESFLMLPQQLRSIPVISQSEERSLLEIYMTRDIVILEFQATNLANYEPEVIGKMNP